MKRQATLDGKNPTIAAIQNAIVEVDIFGRRYLNGAYHGEVHNVEVLEVEEDDTLPDIIAYVLDTVAEKSKIPEDLVESITLTIMRPYEDNDKNDLY